MKYTVYATNKNSEQGAALLEVTASSTLEAAQYYLDNLQDNDFMEVPRPGTSHSIKVVNTETEESDSFKVFAPPLVLQTFWK